MADRPVSTPASLLPREHGAWGLLLQPFAAGAIVSAQWSWLLIPALAMLLSGFMLREPLVVLARQAFVWRTRNPAAARALRWAVWESVCLAACFYWLSHGVPLAPLTAFVAAGGLLTLAAVWMTIRNRQRSRTFQMASAAALGWSAPFAILVSSGSIPAWSWLLWGLLTLHGVASILIVHLRLDRRAAARTNAPPATPRAHYAIQALQLPVAAAAASQHPLLLVPPVFSILANLLELRRLSSDAGLRESLNRVGMRTLVNSLVHLALTILCLWPVAHAG